MPAGHALGNRFCLRGDIILRVSACIIWDAWVANRWVRESGAACGSGLAAATASLGEI